MMHEIVVPSFFTFPESDDNIIILTLVSPLDPIPIRDTIPESVIELDKYVTVDEIKVLTEVVHLEVVPGSCVLENVPPPHEKSIDLSIKDTNVKMSGP